jgi:uncharacterized protein (TIGR02246 family)
MDIQNLLDQLTAAARAGDGAGVAALFTEDGVYHDCFYGDFQGREAIRAMIDEHFHRDGENFTWEMTEALRQGDLGYARYRFGYTSRIEGSAGRRVVFEGMSRLRFQGDQILRYDEIFDSGMAMAQLGFTPERMARFLERQTAALRARPDMRPHLGE